MPELPEVETTLRGIKPHILHQTITAMTVRHQLRWPIPKTIEKNVVHKKITSLSRRGKYLLLHTDSGTLIFHLGMSGSIRILKEFISPNKHDHIDIIFSNKIILRYTDPRRFGAVIWTSDDPFEHKLLKQLGPEPLEKNFTATYLFTKAQSRTTSIKAFLMDSKIVAGVGNIYATEALFAAGIHPKRPAGKVSLIEFKKLVSGIRNVLNAAIKKGGTTLRNFTHGEGVPGYFNLRLKVYGRENLPCIKCKKPLKLIRQGQRATVFCSHCQS